MWFKAHKILSALIRDLNKGLSLNQNCKIIISLFMTRDKIDLCECNTVKKPKKQNKCRLWCGNQKKESVMIAWTG